MDWGEYFALFGLSTFKFMFAPLGGVAMKLNYFETYFSCVAGAIFSASVFFFMSDFFIKRAERKRREKLAEMIAKALPIKKKKVFTFGNKLIIRIKKTFGIYGVCMWVPLFLSIPVGSIVAAKFYGKDKRAFPLVILGVLVNGLILTTLAYSKQLF